MLAYIFWHRPFPHVASDRYEEAIVRFQSDLAREPPPGFIAAASFAIEGVPWLGDKPGYEDWCLLEGSWALDPLNSFAVTGSRQPSHDSIAALMEDGHGGIYAHAGGETPPPQRSMAHWLTRPRGVNWQAALEPVRAKCPQANIWRRQMVLGRATEFAVTVPEDMAIEVPVGWQVRSVKRVRLLR
jgi:hypothetical protein